MVAIGLALALVAPAGRLRADFLGGDASKDPSQRLKAIFHDYWVDELRTDPLEATFVGDHRFDDRLGDPSDAAHRAKVERDRAARDALRGIDPAKLSADERIDRQVLLVTLHDRLEGERFRGHLIPLTQQEGLHLKFAQSVNFHPVGTVGDLENYVRRLHAFPAAIDATIAVMRQGVAEKRVPPRVTMAKVVPQLRALATAKPEDSPLYGIVAKLPGEWPEADRKRGAGAVRAAVAEAVSPAYARLAQFVESEYLPACRESVGLWDSPEGETHYAYRARSFTTTTLSPAEIHEIGLREMARTRAAMEAIRVKVGFVGDLPAFFQSLKTDPKLKNRSEQEILSRYTTIFEAIDPKLPSLFGRLPKTDYAIRPIEPYRAKAAASGYYYMAPEDGSRPGYFYVNTYEPASRPTYTMQALAYHEGVPGHHLQFCLAMEAPGRPAFRRFGYVPAFSEGWGLYSEGLPAEVGLYTDPYAEFGRLEFDALRCGRLVVDTGLHHKRWTRAQAIEYLEANTASPRLEIESEVDRYIAWPGQALAYKIGELKIRELRARAERREGQRFDLRSFHDRLLSQGSIPLSVLKSYLEK
jgi:prolyl oligopeptidase